jgi:dihydrofolate reductase
MRRVVLYQLLSLDGVAEEPGDWMADGGEGVFANLARVTATQDTILLGRGTYDYWAGFWPHDGPEPFRGFVNGTPKHVFTSRPLEPEWENTVVVGGPAADHVRAALVDLDRPDAGTLLLHYRA